MIRRRIALATGVTALAVLGSALPVWALFSAQTSATQTATATALGAGSTPAVAVSGRDLVVSWSASALPGSAPAASSNAYTLQRFDSSAPTVAIAPQNGCAGTLTALTCREAGLSAGSWTYRVTPQRSAWLGAASGSSTAATVASAALALSPSTLTAAGGATTGTVTSYLDNETVSYCLDLAAAACTSSTRIGFATVPATGGSVAATLTVPAGTSVGAHTISAYGSLGTASSQALTVVAAAASRLAYATQPVGGGAGVAFPTQPVVLIQDAYGNTVTTSTATVTLAIGTNPTAGVLSGCLSSTSAGVATFSGCKIDRAGTGFTLVASSAGLTGATSSAFTITGGLAGLFLDNAMMKITPVTFNCGTVSTNRTCTGGLTAQSGNRDFTFNVRLVDSGNNAVTNPTGSPITVTYTQTGGSGISGGTTIASTATGTSTVTVTIANNNSATFTATATVGGVTYVVRATVS